MQAALGRRSAFKISATLWKYQDWNQSGSNRPLMVIRESSFRPSEDGQQRYFWLTHAVLIKASTRSSCEVRARNKPGMKLGVDMASGRA